MTEPAIRVEKLCKRYLLGNSAGNSGYRTLRESLTEFFRRPLRRSSSPKEFWALNDVSFEIQPGEVVGIIGKNGAGKSTLLKVLSRITRPTRGRYEINGRIGSLLEVGTGFHPELTGRENVYLNGSILGMTRREIAKKFAEIVSFAEVEKFLDTPVKRYSSGMYVRLAFAVAAHLEPEILIVDEVLAVGDATFQRRCIDRMAALAANGKTILFVSHNFELVARLCRSAIRLESGAIVANGPASSVITSYLDEIRQETDDSNLQNRQRYGDGSARFTRAWVIDAEGKPTRTFTSGDDLTVRFEIDSTVANDDVSLAVILQNNYGVRLVTSWNREVSFSAAIVPGKQLLECTFHAVPFRPGLRVSIGLWIAGAAGNPFDAVENALVLNVLPNRDQEAISTNADQGPVLCGYSWRTVGDDTSF